MNNIKAGFSRVNINPPMGIEISGYFHERRADGILDDLEANAIAIEQNGKCVLMISVDNLGIKKEYINDYKSRITEATGVASDHIFISCTHTHTGPSLQSESDEKTQFYLNFLGQCLCDASSFALADLKDAKMGYGVGTAPNIAFVRRFRMKDGSIQTNPGVNNPNIVAPVGDVEERVSVVRFDRDGAESIVIVHFGNHPDVIGGNKISADWPGMLRRNTEKALDNVKCIFFNGAQGDVNHVNVHPTGGYLNDCFIDFDDVARGYNHANYMSRVVLGGVLQAFDKVQYADVDCICVKNNNISIPSNKANPEELPEAHRINDLHLSGRDDLLPYEGMMLTTVVAEAGRMVRLENAPDAFELPISGLCIGPVAFVGIPGEPFTGIGRGIRDTSEPHGFEMILPLCITNGYEGYFPMYDAYAEGGYEARSSNFKAGVAEIIIDEGKKILSELKNKKQTV